MSLRKRMYAEQEEPFTMFQTTDGRPVSVSEIIIRGDRVSIRNRFGQVNTGKAVMKGPHGWVLNMGGAHGTPGIADDRNVVMIRRSGQKKPVYDGRRAGEKV